MNAAWMICQSKDFDKSVVVFISVEISLSVSHQHFQQRSTSCIKSTSLKKICSNLDDFWIKNSSKSGDEKGLMAGIEARCTINARSLDDRHEEMNSDL